MSTEALTIPERRPVIVGAVLAWLVIFGARAGAQDDCAEVPEVTGIEADDAIDEIEAKGFTPVVTYDFSPMKDPADYKDQTVKGQHPKGLSRLSSGETVHIWVSGAGEASCTIWIVTAILELILIVGLLAYLRRLRRLPRPVPPPGVP